MKQYDIAIIGGDNRNTYLADILEKSGHRIICFEIPNDTPNCVDTLRQAMGRANIIVGGIPLYKEDTINGKMGKGDLTKENFINNLQKKHIVFGGMLTKDFIAICREKGVIYYDFMKDETLTQKNAIATAEGAIFEALKNQQTNIHQSKCLVLGYGRCGSVLAEKLKGLSANVTVSSKDKVELARAESFGMNVFYLDDLEKEIETYEYIFNTIPAQVITEHIIKGIEKSAVIIDIASGLGGVDYRAARKANIRAFHCQGIPGKYAARISALYMADYIIMQMESREGFL